MPHFANALILDGGSDLLRTRAALAAGRVKQHVVRGYSVGDSYATVVGLSCGSVDLVAGDMVQSGAAGAARTTTFAAKNITLTANSNQYDAGTATAGSSTTLTDSAKAWTTNQHANRALVITGGTGAGQSRRIASNTGTVVTVTTAFTVTPDATSTYAIRDDLHTAVVDSVSSDVLYVTDESNNQQLTSGNVYQASAYTWAVGQPAAV